MDNSTESPSSPDSTSSSSILATTLSPATSTLSLNMFNGNGSSNGETFSVNGEEVAVEPLEMSPLDGKDENCKHCQ